VFIEIRGICPGAVLGMEVEDGAFTDVNEKTNVKTASKKWNEVSN
jgi:hypothetical protein